ncbi:MAG: ABC transporter permease [Acidimicrobiales bacterium]
MTDGVLSFITAGASAVNDAPGGATQPRAQLVEVDFAAARAFGPDPAITGIEGDTPSPGSAAITDDLADRLNLRAGGRVTVYAYGQQRQLQVDRVLPRTGVAGYWNVDGRQQSYNVLVAPGTIASLLSAAARSSAGSSVGSQSGDATFVPPEVTVAISNVGGVVSGATSSDAAITAIDEVVGPFGLAAVPVKQSLLDLAEENGKGLSDLYFTIGMFAVAAGVMLLVNIFVMLADERRSELGMLRAIGMRQAPLVGAFALEGWLYALVSSALGAVVGIGVGRVIAWRADAILSSGREDTALKMAFSFTANSVLNGFALGFLIALVTIVVTSVRIARFNVIRAIRDIREPHRARPRRRYARIGQGVALLGLGYSILGFATSNGYGVMLGPALFVAGVVPVLARRWPGRTVATTAAVVVLVWEVVAVPILAAMDVSIDIPIFLVQGLTMTAAAIVVVNGQQEAIGRLMARLSGRSLPVRLGLAYPLARRFRTGMTLGMFSIVMLTLVYMSVLSYMFQGQTDRLAADLAGGFEIVTTSNPSNPVTRAELDGIDGVDSVAPVAFVAAEFERGRGDPLMWPVTGIGPEVLSAPPKLVELGAYESNDAAWAAVYEDPSLIVVDNNFLVTAGGPGRRPAEIGDVITMRDPQSGEQRDLTVAAKAEDDLIGSGPYVSGSVLRELFGTRASPSRFLVSASAPADTAVAIRSAFIANGADASTVASVVESVQSQGAGFFTLMQQFVGAGLVVGVAGIGVIMVRAVRERRREVGVLRSLGFLARSVSQVLVFEAAFVAVEGILIGVTIALVASYGFAAAGADWAEGLTWGVPIGEVALIISIAVISTLVAALWPARRAAHIHPAAALRITD